VRGVVVSTPTIGRKRELKWLPVEQIIKNELNPRSESAFKQPELESLRDSIRTHGILDPVIVTPYDDLYKLIEGERRYACAKLEGLKEVPAYVVPRMSGHEEVVTMFHLHMQRRGWEFAEQLLAIQRLRDENGHMSHEELATELGMSVRTLKDRLELLGMGQQVITSIARGELDPYVALRARQTANTLARHRPEIIDRSGGAAAVQNKLIKKSKKHGKGKTREFEQIKAEARDTAVTPDAVLEAYIQDEDLTLSDARRQAATLQERRAVEELTKRLASLEKELRHFRIDLDSAPNLRDLRRALASLAETATNLELRVSDAMREAGISS
jgi:ParB family transcriptional regulator, chromosome partitioning protein